MGPKRFWSQNFSLFIVKFKKLAFIAPLSPAITKLLKHAYINENDTSDSKQIRFLM